MSHSDLPLSFDWAFLMVYSKAKFKSNYEKTPPSPPLQSENMPFCQRPAYSRGSDIKACLLNYNTTCFKVEFDELILIKMECNGRGLNSLE